MKNIIYIILFFSISITAQHKYLTKSGTVKFEASVPSFEEVKAINKSASAIINIETGEFAA
ncbi:MAG: YceI family protein, partial [Bacteroidetes bacterium]|nr:YceI family protein [Bacteroidota bacterium]